MIIRYFTTLLLFSSVAVYADDNQSLSDFNGDGQTALLSFGDSITYGVGDGGLGTGVAADGGYPGRLERLLGIPVDNEGVPGEELTGTGYLRFAALLRRSNADTLLIQEGANDAFKQIPATQYRNTLQKMINAAKILNKQVVLMTLPTPCCNHGQLIGDTQSYSGEIETLSIVNELELINLKKAWETTCNNPGECDLYNLPEGLHPTATGYTVMSQTVAATLLGIDIFKDGGAAELEGALGLPEGSVLVKPDPLL